MGCVSSICREKEELRNKIKVLSRELYEVKIKNEQLQSSLRNISRDTKSYMKDKERMNKLISTYKKVLSTDSEKTANIIMSGALHLTFMDDLVEKKHIQDVLQASYDMVNC